MESVSKDLSLLFLCRRDVQNLTLLYRPYFKEAYPLHAGEFALLNAFIMSVVGGGSGILGGYVADSLGAWIKDAKVTSSSSLRMISDTFDEQTIRLMLPIVGSLLAIPTWYYTINNTGTFKTGQPKRRAVEMGGKLRNIVKYSSTYQSKALLLLFRMVIK